MRPARVLLVDDEIFILRAVFRVLTHLGCSVHVAGDARRALELLRDERFDLLVTDNRMPGLDGPGLIARVRADPRQKNLRIVLCSAVDDRSGFGEDTFLPKPFETDDLRRILSGLEPRA